jgi:hypothetical protein
MVALFVTWNHASAEHLCSLAIQETLLPILLLLLLNSTDRNIRGHEDEILFDVFVVCRNIFHKTKYCEKTLESHACLISIFLFRKWDICKLGAKSYFTSYLREK